MQCTIPRVTGNSRARRNVMKGPSGAGDAAQVPLEPEHRSWYDSAPEDAVLAGRPRAMGDGEVSEDGAAVRDGDGTIASPCIGVCTLDPQTKLCIGCLRSDTEIAAWRNAASDLRLRILERVRLRRAMGYEISTRVLQRRRPVPP